MCILQTCLPRLAVLHCRLRGRLDEEAYKIIRLPGVREDLAPTTSNGFADVARPPAYSVLTNHRLGELGMDDVKDWREALAEYLRPRMDSPWI